MSKLRRADIPLLGIPSITQLSVLSPEDQYPPPRGQRSRFCTERAPDRGGPEREAAVTAQPRQQGWGFFLESQLRGRAIATGRGSRACSLRQLPAHFSALSGEAVCAVTFVVIGDQ